MLKKYTFECFKALEVQKEGNLPSYFSCHFAKDAPWHGYVNLECSDEILEAWEEDLRVWPEDAQKTENEIKWIKYFRSLGYRDVVIIYLA